MRRHDCPTPLLRGLSPRRFLARHWQRRPLLARDAIEGFAGLLSPRELVAFACRDDVQSRVVVRMGSRWHVHHGPFEPRFFRRLPSRGWTLLVQDVNHYLPGAQALLQRFDFIPYARLDDLMVSYAPPGGGVGPHFDSYDVFLLQGLGHRRWSIGRQRNLALLPDAPLKLLAEFRPERTWVLGPGDMLYLPPSCAHDGVAEDECMTYSIGFRAPAWQELAVEFLSYLQDQIALEGMYADRGLEPALRPARIGTDLLRAARSRLDRIRWSRADVLRFLGRHLTEPKSHVFFERPRRALSLHGFRRRAVRAGVALTLKSQMLYEGSQVFINGEAARLRGRALARTQALADARRLRPGDDDPRELFEHLYRWYRAGYLQIGPESSQ
jgi:50S ribosomal protein L16 3-hydroxylase